MRFKRGKWSWVHMNDQPVPFPVFKTPKRRRDDPHKMPLERCGAWWIAPVLVQEDGDNFRHRIAGWLAVCPGASIRDASEWSQVFTTKAAAKAWADKQPTPRRFALVAV